VTVRNRADQLGNSQASKCRNWCRTKVKICDSSFEAKHLVLSRVLTYKKPLFYAARFFFARAPSPPRPPTRNQALAGSGTAETSPGLTAKAEKVLALL
jgi:hypothetical protein